MVPRRWSTFDGWSGVALLFGQSAELFFVAADVAGDGLERAAELVDLDGQAGEGERFAGLLAVFLDQGAELGTPVEGGPADAGEGGDGVGGDGCAVGGELGAGVFDAEDVVGRRWCAGRVVAHPVWAAPSAPSSTSRRAIRAW